MLITGAPLYSYLGTVVGTIEWGYVGIHEFKYTARLGKAKFDSFQSTLIKPKLCGPHGLYERGAHTKFQLPTCKWARETLG